MIKIRNVTSNITNETAAEKYVLWNTREIIEITCQERKGANLRKHHDAEKRK